MIVEEAWEHMKKGESVVAEEAWKHVEGESVVAGKV